MTPPGEDIRLLRIFVSSPGDVADERAVLDDIVARINRTMDSARAVRLEVWRWEKGVVPRIGPRPQDVVDAQTPRYDIYLGIMSARFGTPTEGYGSGTEKEFRDALAAWGEDKRPWILFYFDDDPPVPKTVEASKQYVKVLEFREELKPMGIVGTFKGSRGTNESFFEQVDDHLRKLVQNLFPLSEQATESTASPAGERATGSRRLDIPASYRAWVDEQCQEVSLLGLKPKLGIAPVLTHVYVPLTTTAAQEFDPEGTISRGQARASGRRAPNRLDPGKREREQPQLLLDLLSRESLYVSGDPGSGKSTFCRWVTRIVMTGTVPEASLGPPEEYRESFPDALRDRLPLLIRLRELWEFLPQTPLKRDLAAQELAETLKRWAEAKLARTIDWPVIEARLACGQALVILDGMDEVPLARGREGAASYPRAMLVSGLAAAFGAWTAAGNRVLLTSRPYGIAASDAPRMLHAPIEGLPAPLQELLVQRWFHILSQGTAAGSAKASDMLEHVRERDWLEPLTINPLLLTAMCIVYDEGSRLPQHKYDLYDRIVETVLVNRYPEGPERERVRGFLCFIAHGAHTGQGLDEARETPLPEATNTEVEALLRVYFDESSWGYEGAKNAVETRDELVSRSGLLVARGDGHAAFFHLSFQEFLAAEKLADLDVAGLVEVFIRRAAVPEWRNTLSFLLASQLPPKRSSPERATRLLASLIEALRPETIGLLLVVADGVQLLLLRGIRLQEALIKAVRDACRSAVEREEAAGLQDRYVLGLALGRLGDERIAPDLRQVDHPARPYVQVPAGGYQVGDKRDPFRLERPLLVARYPVTNGQFELFVNEDGYERAEWWSDDGKQWLEREKPQAPRFSKVSRWNGPNQPVVGVSFWEAEAFAKWAGGRLPREHEWEAAARGPEGLEFPWGAKYEDGICNSSEAGLRATSPVGLFPRSRSHDFDLEDMAGNVWEWCDSPEGNSRVLRGGSWGGDSGFLRSAFRSWYQPVGRVEDVGFRMVRELDARTR